MSIIRKMEALQRLVRLKLDEEKNLLNSVSEEIWKRPELKYEEHFAHDLLTKILKEKGFQVQEHYILPTAFRAEFESAEPGPTVAIICEYDALPDVGHACGHNLIAEAGLGAAIAIKAAMEFDKNLHGKVVVLGTPAEEGGGGKIELVNACAFKDIDAALMVHPAPGSLVYPPLIACDHCTVTFIGKETHAAAGPWEGLNALDAAVAAYNNVALLRQQIKPSCRIHGVITNGGSAPNVIPGRTELVYYCRAGLTKELKELITKFDNCCEGAARATGCQVDIQHDEKALYYSVIHNKVLAEKYKKYAESLGVEFMDAPDLPYVGSSDMGNVSQEVPSIHPVYGIGTMSMNHSIGFAEAAGKPEAQAPTIIATESMACVALELMLDPKVLADAKKQFQEDLAAEMT